MRYGPYHLKGYDLNSPEIKGIILSGSRYSIGDANAPSLPPQVLESGKPVLGICYGMQLLVSTQGGKVVHAQGQEHGKALLQVVENRGIFENLAGDIVLLDEPGR